MKRELSNKLQLLLRSEKALMKLEMRKKGRQVVLVSIAILAILATLVMLNVSTYLYLIEKSSPLNAALVLMAIDLAVAILFFILAARQELGSEAEAINEIRDYAMKELSGEFDEMKNEASAIRENFTKVSAGIGAVKLAIPFVEMFVKKMSKNK